MPAVDILVCCSLGEEVKQADTLAALWAASCRAGAYSASIEIGSVCVRVALYSLQGPTCEITCKSSATADDLHVASEVACRVNALLRTQ